MIMKEWTVPAEFEGIRAGEYLRRMLPSLSESEFRLLFDARDVKLDGKRIKKTDLLKAGQSFRVYLPGSSNAQELRIIYEDEDVLLINKRPGISVVSEDPGELTLTALCRDYVRRADPEAFPPQPCHRLDHQTGGLCLFARNEAALSVLLDVFRSRTLRKEYTCLVRGLMKPPEAECRAYLVKDPVRSRVRVTDDPEPGALPIITAYRTLLAGPVSRLCVHLITGRTHQIRAHLAALGHPILGDDVYGDRDFNRLKRVHSLRLWATSLTLDTGGRLPNLDGKTFAVQPPF